MEENIFYVSIYRNNKSEKSACLNLVNAISDFAVVAKVILMCGQAGSEAQTAKNNNKKAHKRHSDFFHRQLTELMRNTD